jgi:hypothetical protein
LKQDFNIFSTRELSAKQGKETLQKQAKEMDCKFKDIKPRHVKDQLIMNYASELKKKYKLTNAEFPNLLSTIQLGFQFKSLGAKDVDYRDGEIKEIKGLEFLEDKRVFIVPETTAPNTRNEKSQNSDRFYSVIKKYLKDNETRFAKFIS